MSIETEPMQSNRTPTRPTAGDSRRMTRFIFSGVLGALLATVIFSALADDPPVLTIAPLGGGVFSITVTNAASPTNYLLEWTPVLADTNYPWLVVATNAPGATNWVMNMGAWPIGFLRVMVGWDGDGDAVPEWMDANPFDPSVGVLSVTIDSPINGATLN